MTSTQFKRKTYAKGFNNHKALDEFIQNSLGKYIFVDASDEMYEATGVYSKYIVSNKSAIPDLVIWNKKFNKNECFYDSRTKEYNSFPRFKFILKAKPPLNQNQNPSKKNIQNTRNEVNEIKNEENQYDEKDDDQRYDNYEEEDIQWEDIDVKELEKSKMKFQALPGSKQAIEEEIEEKVEEKIRNIEKEEYTEDFTNQQENTFNKVTKVNKELSVGQTLIPLENLFLSSQSKTKNENIEDSLDMQEETITPIMNKNENRNKVFGNIVQLEKGSLFENDFTSMFLGDSSKSKNDSMNMKMNEVEESNVMNMIIRDNVKKTSNTSGSSNNKYSNLNFESEIQLNLNGENELQKSHSMNNMNNMGNMGNMNNMNNMNKMGPNMNFIPGKPFGNFNMPPGFFIPPVQGSFIQPPQFFSNDNFMNNNNNMNMNMMEAPQNDMSNLLENPISIVKKNMTKRGWFLMTDNNKILGNYNSLDLMKYLEDKMREGSKFDNIFITDYDTDIYFTPSNLYEVLRENLPQILDQIKSKKNIVGMGNQNRNMMNMNKGMNNQKMPSNMPFIDPQLIQMQMNQFQPFGMMPDPRMGMGMNMSKTPKSNSSQQPLNMNINLQVVKNNFNLNNFMLNQQNMPMGNFPMQDLNISTKSNSTNNLSNLNNINNNMNNMNNTNNNRNNNQGFNNFNSGIDVNNFGSNNNKNTNNKNNKKRSENNYYMN